MRSQTQIEYLALEHFESIEAFNEYVGIAEPLREGIDIGTYQEAGLRLSSPAVTSGFYRISIKYDFEDADLVEEANPEFSPSAFMFFSSPNQPVEWNVPKMWSGYYIQIDRQIINANKHLFFNFMGYGLHEGLYLTENEKNQIEQLLAQLYQVYHQENYSKAITLSYCHLVFSYIEYFYKRQFKTKKDAHNRLVKLFISELNEFYPSLSQKKFGTPTVQFFASKLNTTPNYLGDVVRNITGLSPIEHIHQTIIKEAKALLKQGIYSNSEIAYHLGFEYPNYFSRLFKKLEGISPTEFKGK
ncbi:MAG: AraC family transcriptional regulator [Saprospiraceae bacterium]|nr:AraC family transcriptional regulator [Saprospiraceae bacterium]